MARFKLRTIFPKPPVGSYPLFANSILQSEGAYRCLQGTPNLKRRGGDSNSRKLSLHPISSRTQSTTLPPLRANLYYQSFCTYRYCGLNRLHHNRFRTPIEQVLRNNSVIFAHPYQRDLGNDTRFQGNQEKITKSIALGLDNPGYTC